MFSNLDMDSDSDNIQCSRENEIRKAKKELKAIEKLKHKDNLTPEEEIKLQNETIFRRVINPAYISPKEQHRIEQDELIRKKEKQKKSLKKDKLTQSKLRKEQERKYNEERRRNEEQQRRNEEQQRRNEEQERYNEEQRRRNEEQERYNKEQQDRFEYQQRQLYKQQKQISKLEKRIEYEFNELLTTGLSKKKAKHKMLLQYHPDKNLKDINLANKISCIINDFT